MPKFHWDIEVECDTEAQAEQVIAERLSHDEDYGFDYRIEYGHRTKTGRLLTDKDFERLADEAESKEK
jgi:hypothetical protein